MFKISQNSQLFPESKDLKFSDVLMQFSESLLDINSEDEILWMLAKNCISKLGFIDCVVYLLDESRNVMVQKAAYGPKNPKGFEISEPVERPIGFGIVGHVAKTGNAELINDTSNDVRYKMDDEFRFSEVCVPIIIDGEVIGIIDCEHPEKNFFSEHHLHMLLTISSICAIKIKGVRTNKKYIQQQKQTFEIEKQLVDLKLKALSTQMNPHFVFNSLNAIQYFITSGQKKSALEYLSIFSKLIRFYLKHIESETVNLNDEINMLNWYIKLQKLRYTDKFEYTMNVEKEQKNLKAIIPSFVIQTLFENIIEHAIFNQHQNEKLVVSFQASINHVLLKINYKHDVIDSTIIYTPEYRKRITKWQDQIELLNTIKKYDIKKEMTFSKNQDSHSGQITIKLPNLA
ncbi:putative orphan protein; putative GGDEF protein [Flavobacteriales bacterium ALC-1]|nr:putative orphan protein; putative GGDEF protein [Flavobacteriales bacterium ALC-1]